MEREYLLPAVSEGSLVESPFNFNSSGRDSMLYVSKAMAPRDFAASSTLHLRNGKQQAMRRFGVSGPLDLMKVILPMLMRGYSSKLFTGINAGLFK